MLKLTVLVTIATLSLSLAQDGTEGPLATVYQDVTVLDLSNHGITSLTEYDFSTYTELEELDLSNNDITHINTEKFLNNHKLRKLNLSGNKNLELPEFASLLIADSIEELDLSGCNIATIPGQLFDGTVYLKTINLSDNPLEDNGIKMAALNALMSPSKLVLPRVDEEMFREICKQLNIEIEVEWEPIQCSDVRDGTWQNTPKEGDPIDIELETTNERAQVEEDHQSEGETQVEEEEEDHVQSETEDANGEETKTDGEEGQSAGEETNTELPNISVDLSPEETNNTDPPLEDTVEEKSSPSPQEESVNEQSPSSDTTDIVISLNSHPTEEPQPKQEDPSTVETTGNSDPEPPGPVSESSQKVDQTEDQGADGRSVPDAVDGAHATPDEVPQAKEQPPVPLQRGLMRPEAPTSDVAKTPEASPQPNKSEKIQEEKTAGANGDTTKMSESSQSSTGTNVLVFLVIAVVVAGAAAFGYKFYKSRKYKATTRAAEPQGRELKEIVVDKRTNGSAPTPNDVIEEEPLMKRRTNSVEVKEIDETSEARDGNEVKVVGKPKSEVSSPYQSGPYVPTTSPVKPPHVNKDDTKEI